MFKGTKMLSQRKLMRFIKEQQLIYLTKRCQIDKEFSENIYEDKNQMKLILVTSYCLKTVELTVVLLHFSFMLGLLWFISCETVEDFFHNTNYYELGLETA